MPARFWIPVFVLFIFQYQASAQVDSILHLPKEVQEEALEHWFGMHESGDSAIILSRLDRIEEEFKTKKEFALMREAWFLKWFYRSSLQYAYEEKVISRLDNAIAEAHSRGWPVQEAQLYVQKGLVLLVQQKQVPGFENLMIGYDRMKQIGFDQIPNAHGFLLAIGNSYLQIQDYDSAIRFMRESLSSPIMLPDSIFQLSLMNTIGVCFQRMMEYDSAIIFFMKAHKAATDIRNEFWMSFTNGNLGYAYFKKGESDKALPLMETDFETSVRVKEIGSAVNAALALASVYLGKGNSVKAEYYIQYCIDHVNRQEDNTMATFYYNLYEFSKIKGDYRAATQYIDSSKVYKDRYDATTDKAILEKAQLQVALVNHASELKALESMRRRQVLARNGLLAMLLLSGIIALLLINRRNLNRKKELELAHAELQHYTNTIREKNELIDSFSDEIEKMRVSEYQHLDERTGHLTELLQASILTEDDWRHFRELFDKVHPGFFIRLKEKMADLSPAETRLLALTKLKLAPREMASMLGISYEAIKKTRQRLRKKINLPEEGSVDELVDMI